MLPGSLQTNLTWPEGRELGEMGRFNWRRIAIGAAVYFAVQLATMPFWANLKPVWPFPLLIWVLFLVWALRQVRAPNSN